MNSESIPIERHPLTPFLPSNGRLLMLGSFPPQQKRWAMDFYYPNFTNDMWRIIGLVFFNNALHFVDQAQKTYHKEAIINFLNQKGIGIFDTACEVRRLQDNASDKFLEIVTSTDINALLAKMPLCRSIVTTGEKATETICKLYDIIPPKVGIYTEFDLNGESYRLYRMPSTSRAYPLSLEKKAESYMKMFGEVFSD